MSVKDLNERSLEIFKELVETYLEYGDPVSSRTLSKRITESLSSATIRNIMADLEDAGMLYSPHTSSGRIPTEEGMRFFVDAIIEQSDLEDFDFSNFENELQYKSVENLMQEASSILSGLSQCASIVITPTLEHLAIKQIEFINLGGGKGLVILVSEDGSVENRLININENISQHQLNQATRYINQHHAGKPLNDILSTLLDDLESDRSQLDELSKDIIKEGIALWSGDGGQHSLIVKGQSNLLSNVQKLEDLDNIRKVFQKLDEKENVSHLLDAAVNGKGIKLFIGSENKLFDETCSLVVSPYFNQNEKVIGAIGVIGPVHMNYRRIIPLVDYSAKLISKLLNK